MTLRTNMLASVALHPAMMTAAERAAGRFLRAPDGHAAAVAEPPAPAEPAQPETPLPIESEIPASTGDAYDKEFEGVTLDDSEEGQPPAAEEAAEEPTPEAAEEPGAPSEEKTADQLRIEELERQVAELSRPKKEEEPAPQPEAAVEDKAPNPDDYEFGKVDDKYISDLAAWSSRMQFAKLQQEADFKAELTAIETGWKGAISKPEITEQYPDFDTVVTQGAANQSWECSIPMALLIKNSEVGPHIAYELAKDPSKSAQLAKMHPQELLLEFGRIEGRHLAKAEAPPPPPAAPNRTTAAPTPPTNRSRGAGGQFENEQDALYGRMLKEFK